jgi:hypothetical protein
VRNALDANQSRFCELCRRRCSSLRRQRRRKRSRSCGSAPRALVLQVQAARTRELGAVRAPGPTASGCLPQRAGASNTLTGSCLRGISRRFFGVLGSWIDVAAALRCHAMLRSSGEFLGRSARGLRGASRLQSKHLPSLRWQTARDRIGRGTLQQAALASFTECLPCASASIGRILGSLMQAIFSANIQRADHSKTARQESLAHHEGLQKEPMLSPSSRTMLVLFLGRFMGPDS